MRDDNNNHATLTVKCKTNHIKESIGKFTDKVPTQTWFLHRRTTSIHFAPQQIQEQNRYVFIELSFNFHVHVCGLPVRLRHNLLGHLSATFHFFSIFKIIFYFFGDIY